MIIRGLVPDSQRVTHSQLKTVVHTQKGRVHFDADRICLSLFNTRRVKSQLERESVDGEQSRRNFPGAASATAILADGNEIFGTDWNLLRNGPSVCFCDGIESSRNCMDQFTGGWTGASKQDYSMFEVIWR